MFKRKGLVIMCLALALVALFFGLSQAGEQNKGITVQETSEGYVITDSAGRTHVVMPMRRTTPEDRKAASERLRAAHEAAAQEKQNAPAPEEGVTK